MHHIPANGKFLQGAVVLDAQSQDLKTRVADLHCIVVGKIIALLWVRSGGLGNGCLGW